MTRKAFEKIMNLHLTHRRAARRIAVFCALLIAVISAARTTKAATFSVSNNADSGAGSLRQAILDANAATGADIISFTGFSGTITPATSLPQILDTVTIDGYTASGSVANTGGISAAFNGNITVELSGASAGPNGIGLRISASNCVIQGLAINRFEDSGIRIDAGTNARIFGNFIGTNLAGTAAAGNFNRGILIVGSTGNFIGFTTNLSRNVISGNLGTGISVTGGGSATIRKNLIGTDKTGTLDLGNTQDGIRIADSSNNLIGGSDRNIISGNDGSGVAIIQSRTTTAASSNTVTGNYIGVDITGNATMMSGAFQTSPVGNSGSGVLINAAANVIGGVTAAARNIISGNRANGVSVSSNFSSGNTVTGNYIGVGANGTVAIGNRDNGVQISNLAAGNDIGGTVAGAGNLIASNGDNLATSARAGVYMDETAAVGNAIRRNSIFANTGLGIDLQVIGATANDNLDPDAGANNQQNKPLIALANDIEFIQGTLNSTANTVFTIDFFVNDAADTNNLEGRTYLGSLTTSATDAAGNVSFSYTSPLQLTVGQIITATATSPATAAPVSNGDTSEFSDGRVVTTAGATAGAASISGRLRNAIGTGISGASVELFDADSGETFSATTDADGVYVFRDIPVGGDYIITPLAFGYKFSPTNKLVSLVEELAAVDFVGVKGKKGRFKR